MKELFSSEWHNYRLFLAPFFWFWQFHHDDRKEKQIHDDAPQLLIYKWPERILPRQSQYTRIMARQIREEADRRTEHAYDGPRAHESWPNAEQR